jgi:hypothetical protein
MATQVQQLCSTENDQIYILGEYDDVTMIVSRARYANLSPIMTALVIVTAQDGTVLLNTRIPPSTPETSINIPTPKRWHLDGADAPLINCASYRA